MSAHSKCLPCRTSQALVFVFVSLLATPASSETTGGLVERIETLEAQLDRMEGLLELSVQPWEPVATTVREFDTWMSSDDRLRRFEFAIMRNGGFRILHVSSWNSGHRFMTEPYWRGDSPANFALGGSLWIIGTQDPAEAACTGNTAKHYYYEFRAGTVNISSGSSCTTEGPVYARMRLFKGEIQ
ncbi:MAG: hypothetical protein INF92_13610 [Rhodobacter sp.]|nr:hypothetical protein [Rhodobacter sp.]